MNRPGSINERFTNINKCDICFNNYNRSDKQPVIICTMHHTICKECMTSLESKPNCPFCREHIKFDKVVVNNYIFQLLPQQPPKPNARVEVPQNNQLNFPVQPNRFVANQPSRSVPINPNNPNYQSISRDYSVAHFPNSNQLLQRYPPQPQPALPVPPPLAFPVPPPQSINNRPLQRVYQQDFHQEHQWESSGSANSQLTVVYCLYIFQIPFTFLNLLLALSSPQSECMDKPHRLTILVVRPWLLSMGIIELFLMMTFLLAYLLHLKHLIQTASYQRVKFILIVLAVLKAAIWMFAELQLFQASISRFCSGGIYAYGMVMTIIHGIFILILCCVANCRT